MTWKRGGRNVPLGRKNLPEETPNYLTLTTEDTEEDPGTYRYTYSPTYSLHRGLLRLSRGAFIRSTLRSTSRTPDVFSRCPVSYLPRAPRSKPRASYRRPPRRLRVLLWRSSLGTSESHLTSS